MTQTSACLSIGQLDPRIWHRCGGRCPSEGELGTWHLGLTLDGTGTRCRLLEVERHTSFSRSALSSRACKESHTESTIDLNQTVLRLEFRNQESPSQLTRSPSGKAVHPVTWWRRDQSKPSSKRRRDLDQLLVRQSLPPHLEICHFAMN